jgi:regulator of cell morphogenesis and NO signaling
MTTLTLDTPFERLRDRTVGEIAALLPGATRVFRAFKLDFCCGGEVPLGAAAAAKGLDPADVERALESLKVADVAAVPSETGALIDHILARYHDTHRRELPELIKLATRVEAVHARHPDVPAGLAELLRTIAGELEVHMKKEELILFPALRRGDNPAVSGPIGQMRHEHDDHGARLRELEELAQGFRPPADACRSWQALYSGAAKLVADVMEHVHLENNVLFPRFEALR